MEPNAEEIGLVHLTISKQQIEQFDHVGPLKALSSMRKEPKKYMGKLNISVFGYDEDPREIYEVQEIKDYFDFLDRSFPYFFFFFTRELPKQSSPFLVLVLLLVPFELIKQPDGQTMHFQFNDEGYKKFFQAHFHYFNEIADEVSMSEEEAISISKEIIELALF